MTVSSENVGGHVASDALTSDRPIQDGMTIISRPLAPYFLQRLTRLADVRKRMNLRGRCRTREESLQSVNPITLARMT
jgi:hypothetical protein